MRNFLKFATLYVALMLTSATVFVTMEGLSFLHAMMLASMTSFFKAFVAHGHHYLWDRYWATPPKDRPAEIVKTLAEAEQV